MRKGVFYFRYYFNDNCIHITFPQRFHCSGNVQTPSDNHPGLEFLPADIKKQPVSVSAVRYIYPVSLVSHNSSHCGFRTCNLLYRISAPRNTIHWNRIVAAGLLYFQGTECGIP